MKSVFRLFFLSTLAVSAFTLGGREAEACLGGSHWMDCVNACINRDPSCAVVVNGIHCGCINSYCGDCIRDIE